MKVKFTLEEGTKGPLGSTGIALHFLITQHAIGVGGQRHTPVILPLGSAHYPLYRRLRGPFVGLDRCGKSRPH